MIPRPTRYSWATGFYTLKYNIPWTTACQADVLITTLLRVSFVNAVVAVIIPKSHQFYQPVSNFTNSATISNLCRKVTFISRSVSLSFKGKLRSQVPRATACVVSFNVTVSLLTRSGDVSVLFSSSQYYRYKSLGRCPRLDCRWSVHYLYLCNILLHHRQLLCHPLLHLLTMKKKKTFLFKVEQNYKYNTI